MGLLCENGREFGILKTLRATTSYQGLFYPGFIAHISVSGVIIAQA